MIRSTDGMKAKLVVGFILAAQLVGLWTIATSEPVAAQPPYDPTEQWVHDNWPWPNEAGLAVEIIRCEGWNTTSGFDHAYRSPTGDVGVWQINQVHDDGPSYALRVLFGDATRWPGPAVELGPNHQVAVFLSERRRASGQTGLEDWVNSRHCWEWAVGAVFDVTPGLPVEVPETGLAHTGPDGRVVTVGLLLVAAGAWTVGAGRVCRASVEG